MKVFIEKPKKGKRANLENITKGVRKYSPECKICHRARDNYLAQFESKCIVLFPQAFVDENVKSDASIDSVCSVLKHVFSLRFLVLRNIVNHGKC